jgi:PAS domain S-box-containing protein
MSTDRNAKGQLDSGNLDPDQKMQPEDSTPSGKRLAIHFPNIIEKINEGFIALDAQMNYMYVNQRGSELLRRPPEELIGKNYWEEYPQVRETAFGKAYLQALETHTLIELEDYYAPTDRWFSSRIHPTESGLSIFFNDITERRRTEQILRQKDEQLRRVMEVTPILFAECSRDLRYLFVNRATAEYMGFPAEEIVGKSIRQIIGDETFEKILPYIESTLQGEQVEYELEIPYRAAGSRFMRVIYVPKRDDQGTVMGWLATLADITERRHSEQKLRQSEERFRQAANAAGVLVYEVDPRAGSTSVVHGMESLLGYDSQHTEMTDNWWHSLIHPEDLPAHLAQLDQQLGKGGNHISEYRVQHKNGEWITVQDNWLVIQDNAGEANRLIGAVTDVTERKRAEAERNQLLQSERVQRASAEQSKAEAERELAERKMAEQALGVWASSPLPHETRSVWIRYSVAVMATLIAIVLRMILQPVLGDLVPLSTLFGAVAFSVWYGGLGPALLSVIAGYMGADWFIMEPLYSLNLNQESAIGLGLFLFSSLVVMSLGEEMRRAQRHAHQSAQVAVAKQQQAQSQLMEQKRVEEALRESERKFNLIYDKLPFAATLSSPADGVLVDVNAAFEQLFGYSKQEVLGKNSLELGINPDTEVRARILSELQVRGSAHNVEAKLFTKSGGTRVFLLNIDHVNIGEEQYILQTAQDITERKHAEQALAEFARQQTALYRLADQLHQTKSLEDVFDAALDAILSALPCDRASILLFDDMNVIRFVAWRGLSDAYRAATDGHSPWKPDEQNPEPICMNNIETAALSETLKGVVKSEGISSLAFIPLVFNEKLIGKFMTYYNMPHVFDEDEMDLSLTIARQLVLAIERKRSEENLRRSEERFRTLANTMPSMVWTAAPDGTILFSNDQWYNYTGLTEEENATNWAERVLHPEDYDRCVLEWTRALQAVPDEYRIEVRNRRKDGAYRWFQTRAVPVRNEAGNVTAWYGVTTDIHDRKEAERRLVLLTHISELLRKLEDPQELMYAVVETVGEHFQVKRCLFNEIDLENDVEIVHSDYCHGVPSVAGIHKISDYSSITSAEMEVGKTVVNYDSQIDPRTALDYERSYVSNGERAYVAVPLMRANHWVGTLWVSDDAPRQWSKEEVSLLETIAERTWTVIEKLRINDALRASEQLYRTIARSIPGGGVYVIDRDFRYLVAEGPVTEASGPSREVLEGHTVSEVFPPEPSAQMEERLRRNFSGETVSFETSHNGRVYWTQQAPLLDSLGNAIVVTMDITERKQAEDALRQSEERFTRFMQHLPGLAWIKDPQGRYIYATASAEKAFNVSQGELYGKTDLDIFPPDVAVEFVKNDQRALTEGKGIQVIETLQQQDGMLHYSLVSKFPIPGPDGNPAWIGGAAFDITERKQAEQALQESRERYRNLFDWVPVAVYTCDAQGLIQEFNHRAVELWAREPQTNDPKEKFCGSFKIYYPDGRPMPHEDCPMARMLNGETLQPDELEILVERPDGVRRNVLAHPLPLKNEHGEIVAAINCLYDITERKQAEQALQQLNLELESRVEKRTAQLQAANQALDESHKRLQALSQRLVEVQEEERRAIARELHDRVGQSLAALNLNLTIINNQLSSLVNDQVNARLSDSLDLVADLISLVRDVMSNLRPAVLDDYGLEAALQTNLESLKSRYGISITFEKTQSRIPRLGSSIEMTLLRIAQEALLNVVRHAQAEQVTLSLQMAEQAIHLTVRDDGIGIQSWQTANRPGSHGLTIMRERAEAVGGNLNVSSTAGQGTQIEVSIPYQQQDLKEQK